MTFWLTLVLAFGARAASVFAETVSPWWHLDIGSRPTTLTKGGEGTIVVSATNVGDGEVKGESDPAMFTVTLPAGVEATNAVYSAGHESEYNTTPKAEEACLVVSVEEVLCSFAGTLPPYQLLEIKIDVTVNGNMGVLADGVGVSGGGAPDVLANGSVTVVEGPESSPRFGVESFESIPEEVDGSVATQAGSHPFQWTTSVILNAGTETFFDFLDGVVQPALPKDLRFDLPPGFVGDPSPFPQCSEGQFSAEKCSVEAQLGVVVVTLGYPRGTTIVRPVFNLVPATGEPARVGFNVDGFPVFLDTSVRTGEDYGVTVSANNITQTGAFLAANVTIWGWPGDPRHDSSRGYECAEHEPGFAGTCPEDTIKAPFMTLPTSCGSDSSAEPLKFSVEGDSWEAPENPSEEQAPLWYELHDASDPAIAVDGCNKLKFKPSISVRPDGSAASTATGLKVDEHFPQETLVEPEGLAPSDAKGLSVKLPPGVTLNPAAADGLEACSMSEIALQSAEAPTCPNASKVATVKIKTPLLPEPLEGAAFLATQEVNPFGSLVAMYIYAEDPRAGVRAKVAGEVLENPETGQLTAHFEHDPTFEGGSEAEQFLPQLPYEDVELEFFGGERAPLATPSQCGLYTTTGTFTPWSGNATTESSSEFKITTGLNGSPCPNPLPFAPTLTAQTTSIQAGGFSPFTMTMSREDGNQQLQGLQLHMPPGLLGMLSSVKLCEEPQASEGACGEESKIGETTVSVGLGGDPYSVSGGKVFITGPYHGAPYGLSIEEPAKAGPFDLEHTKHSSPACDCLVVRARIEVNPVTTALTVTTNSPGEGGSIPTILEGIPLQVKHVYVAVNRSNFTFNPTDCNPLKIAGSLTSAEGASASLEVPFQITDCAALAFKPTFAVSTSGHSSRVDGASLDTTVTYPSTPQGTEADIAKVKVSLPAKLPARLTTLQKACPEQTFAAHPADCPAASMVGEATAKTPVLPAPLGGPAYFVSHGGAKYPELVIELRGDNVTIDLHGETAISKKGVLTSTFNAVPDAPFSSFELKLPEGPYSALTANGANLCKAGTLTMPTELVAQDGAVIDQSTKLKVTGCPKKKPKHRAKKGGKHKK